MSIEPAWSTTLMATEPALSDRGFWQMAYVAAITAGSSVTRAEVIAEEALSLYLRRWPVGATEQAD